MSQRRGRRVGGVIAGPVVFAVTVLGSALAADSAHAGAVITSGPVGLGIFDEGHFGFGGVGLLLAGLGDAIIPGCLCEGWGVAGSGVSGYADVAIDGVVNLTVDSFASTASTATSMVHLTSLPGLHVTQAYAPSAGAPTTLFDDTVTIMNTGGGTITDVRYRRVMDWDVPPHVFHEMVTIGGLPATALLFSNDNGFDTANPLGGSAGGLFFPPCGTTVNFTDCGPGDHGAHFDFGFGALGPDESKTFHIFYGAATSESAALAALGTVGAEVFSLGQSHSPGFGGFHAGDHIAGTPGTYIFGFSGVGGTPLPSPTPVIPEPTSLILLGGGLAGLAGWRKRQELL